MTILNNTIEIVSHRLQGGSSHGDIEIFLHSGFHTTVAAGDIAGLPKPTDTGGIQESQALWQSYETIIDSIPERANIAVLFEHPDAKFLLTQIQNKAEDHSQIIIAPLGLCDRSDGYFNSVAVARPGAQLLILDKLSFSYGDLATALQAKKRLVRGTKLNIFEAEALKLAVLNCNDYTHADVLTAIIHENIDILIITTRNPASRLFEEYAIADIHRLCCFVIINNVSDYGGSGVYAPFSRIGDHTGALTLGGTLFSTRGPCEVSALVSLPLDNLRDLREQFNKKLATTEDRYQYIDPPEQVKFYPSQPPYNSIIEDEKKIDTVDLHTLGYRRSRSGHLQIAIAQLHAMSMDDYLDNSYHISRSLQCQAFITKVRSYLELLDRMMASESNQNAQIDFLVFPEVFLPLGFEEEIKVFSQRWNTIIIAGVEYDAQPHIQYYGTGTAAGANRCRMYIPTAKGVETVEYTKLTRSQYDARFRIDLSSGGETKAGLGYFPMHLGNRLLRFTSDSIGTFGVLICYDLSHFDIIRALNLGARAEPQYQLTPLDTLFIIAHNPYAELYRRCCLADCHRFYQYVVMCNVAQYGGSGIFGPLRTSGDRRTLLYAGKNAEGIFRSSIDIDMLHVARGTSDNLLINSSKNSITTDLNGERGISFQRRPGCFQTRFVITREK